MPLFLLLFSWQAFALPPPVNCEKDFSWDKDSGFYEQSPTYHDSYDDTSTWKFSTPSNEGMNAGLLAKGAKKLAAEGGEPYSLLVVRNGSIVLEKYFNGATKSDANNIHSASKSIISAAIGAAIQEGKIKGVGQRLSELMPKAFSEIHDADKRNIRIRDLLTMRSGLGWIENLSEFYVELHHNWVKTILSLPLYTDPGEDFLYNTGLTHLMSAALTKSTGMSTCNFVHSRIFEKIGIRAKHWGRDPTGIYSGGFNVYLTPREMAKFGLLYLNEGKWEGKQVLPAAWVNASMKPQVDTGGGYFYGYNWWVRNIRGHSVAYAWGHGGQFIFVVKDLNLVAVITANTRDYLGTFAPEYILEDYVIPAALN